jgi:hypothetical protein
VPQFAKTAELDSEDFAAVIAAIGTIGCPQAMVDLAADPSVVG